MFTEQRLLCRLYDDKQSYRYRSEQDVERTARSVLDHLIKILNTRKGSCKTRPDFGLPDFNDLVSRFPDALIELQREIKRCIDLYEPRLKAARVNYARDEENPLNIRYEITAQLVLEGKKSPVWFETRMDSSGKVLVSS